MVAQDNWLQKDAGPFTEAGGEVILRAGDLGFRPDHIYTRIQFQFTDLGGGTVDLQVEGPAGEWANHTLNLDLNDVAEVTAPWTGFKFIFSGTGGSGKVTARGYAVGW